MINTIGPVWDGNEVWVLVAGGATFAAFPEWYATLFSGFYLPLLLILVALIVRGLAFEYRHKRDDDRLDGGAGTSRSSSARSCPPCCGASPSPTSSHGVPIDADKEFTGNLFTLLNPFGLLGGLVTLTLFATHGAMFVALKTDGDIRHRARDLAVRIGAVAAAARRGLPGLDADRRPAPPSPRCVVRRRRARAASAASLAAHGGREGWAFVGTFVTIGARGGRAVRRAVPRRDAVDAPTRPSR